MGKKIKDMVSDLTSTSEAKLVKDKAKVGRPSITDQLAKLEAAMNEGFARRDAEIASLKSENATLRATPTRSKGVKSTYNVLDNPNYALPGTFTPRVQTVVEKYGISNPNFNFLTAGGESVIPDQCYRMVMMAHYGGNFWKYTSLWSMSKANFDRFNADLASGTFCDHARAVCGKLIEEKGAPRTEHGQAIAAFYMED